MNNNVVTAVLIDTVSIQKYIFSSNQLKENIGASFMVEQIFDHELVFALKETLGCEINTNEWKTLPDKEVNIQQDTDKCEIGFIGGGNALLFFNNADTAGTFIRQWTFNLLYKAPDLKTAAAVKDCFDFKEFDKHLSELYEQLNQNKNRYFPNTVIQKHGITADDASTGYSREAVYYDQDRQENDFTSSVIKAKLRAADLSQESMVQKYNKICFNRYRFTNRAEQLGQIEDQSSYVSIIHIDGNGMGELFKHCQNLQERRTLSIAVEQATNQSMECLIQYIADHMNYFLDKRNGFSIIQEDGFTILPIRPLVLAGDDVTFITDGRLGIHFAEKYMQFFSQHSYNGITFSSCAGVSIVKTKYPFYQAYEMSESLCKAAKKAAYKQPGTSWIDFHISSGGVYGDLDQIRQQHYTVGGDKLHYGPYQVPSANTTTTDFRNIEYLKNGISQFTNQKEWPRSKIHELRQALSKGKEETKFFITENEYKRKLPNVNQELNYSINGWQNGETPYFDMIELMKFYPSYFLEGSDKHVEIGT